MTGDDVIARIMRDRIYEPPQLVKSPPVFMRHRAAALLVAAVAIAALGYIAVSAWAAAYPLGPCHLPVCAFEDKG